MPFFKPLCPVVKQQHSRQSNAAAHQGRGIWHLVQYHSTAQLHGNSCPLKAPLQDPSAAGFAYMPDRLEH